MQRKAVILTCALITCTLIGPAGLAPAAATRGSRQPASFDELTAGFSRPDMVYAPFTFWFWDEPLQPDKMERMGRTMLEQRLNPGYAHARMNMVGLEDLPRRQWLSPVWMDAFNRVLTAAEQAGCYFGYVDDYWWPSGRAAGRTLQRHPDLWAVSLRWETLDVRGPATVEVPECFFAVAAHRADALDDPGPIHGGRLDPNGVPARHEPARIVSDSLRLVDANHGRWSVPEGSWRLYAFIQYYHPGADGGRLNYLDERLPAAFIELAHEPYAQRFGDRMGRSLPGVFVDNEGDYGYKLAWSDTLDRRYRGQWDRDIRLWMPLLIDEDVEGRFAVARWQWFETVSDIYTEFLGAVSHWLEERGVYCISNLWEETLMWQAGAVGDFFKAQRAYSMPGTDCLGLNALKCHDFKETQSVTEFEGRRMQSEIMGAAGFWGFNPITIKQVANAVTTWGVSHVVPHGIFTTRTLSGNPWLPDWYEQNPMWPWLHQWTDFVRRASFVNSHGHTAADVLLVNPMDSVWALAGPGAFDPALPGRVPVPHVMPLPGPDDIPQTREELKRNSAWWCPPKMDEWFSPAVHHINAAYTQAMNDLTDARVEFLIADRHYLDQMQVRDGRLVRPPFRFRAVVLPPLVVLPSAVAEKLLDFARQGGTVYALGMLPAGSVERGMNDAAMAERMQELRQLPTFISCPDGLAAQIARDPGPLRSHIEFIDGRFTMLQQHRRIDDRHFFWLANNTGSPQRCTIRIPGVAGRAAIWDCEEGTRYPVPSACTDADSTLRLTFEPYEAFWLVIDPARQPLNEVGPSEAPPPVVIAIDGPWIARIDRTDQPPLEHTPTIPDDLVTPVGRRVKLEDWSKWGLERFSGYVDYDTTVTLPQGSGRLQIDLGKVSHLAEVWLDGRSLGKRLWPPFVFEVPRATRTEGPCRLRIRVGNLINNNYGQDAASGLFGSVQLRRLP